MKKCIYYCFYGGNDTYFNILKLSLLSLNIFFDKKNIIVFSDRELPELQELCNVILVKFPEGYAIPMAYRLILGKGLLLDYDKVLHLDLDVIITKNTDKIFELSNGSEISFATENENNPNKIVGDCWAGPFLTNDEIQEYKNINSMCCGVFLFDSSMYDYMEKIYEHIVQVENTGFRGICRDQHAFTEYVLKNKLYNFNLQSYVSHIAKHLVVNNEYDLNSDRIIYHFAGGVTPLNKYELMNVMYLKLINKNENNKQ